MVQDFFITPSSSAQTFPLTADNILPPRFP